MKPPDFQLKIENSDSHLSLGDVSAKEIAQLISTMADILEHAAPESSDESFGVSLASVSEKSIYIANRLSERCGIGAAALLVAHTKLVAFSRGLIGQGRVAKLSGPSGGDVEISASRPIPEIKPQQMRHRSTIYGEVVSAGGMKVRKAS